MSTTVETQPIASSAGSEWAPIPSSDRILGTYLAEFDTRNGVPTMPGMPSMRKHTATLAGSGVHFVSAAAGNQ